MLASHRESEILDALKVEGSCRIQDLAQRLGVTEETIRRNVKKLAAQGLVRRLHGGVSLTEPVQEPSFAHRMSENTAAKVRIARRLAGLIRNGDSMILDIGSTTAYVARALRAHRNLMVVTNSLAVAQTLACRNDNRVFLAGGELRAHDGGAFGREAHDYLRQFRVDHAVLSVAAIDAVEGFLLFDMQEAEFSRAVIARAGRAIVAADATKFGRTAPIRIADPDVFHTLVTDAPPPPDIAAMLNGAGVSTVIADDGPPPLPFPPDEGLPL
ncbi:DeoR/GlpR family DNA-binding transcription regulator [Roseospira navarrensis]|uniref:DeoR family transcriptional regulator n=1 Tax=Roseospira navarrensis TaxID=140058 RepID=A0A7X2D5X0_9PROT|nr:DeoR/GlpR family DNA-binding transcription regulator [Roseospira navarrensis]MQX37690.1 DeoR family transcriptional regulator [Roseospira navarrensis]